MYFHTNNLCWAFDNSASKEVSGWIIQKICSGFHWRSDHLTRFLGIPFLSSRASPSPWWTRDRSSKSTRKQPHLQDLWPLARWCVDQVLQAAGHPGQSQAAQQLGHVLLHHLHLLPSKEVWLLVVGKEMLQQSCHETDKLIKHRMSLTINRWIWNQTFCILSNLRTHLLCQEDTGVGAGVKGVGCDHLPKVDVQLKSNFSTFALKYTLYMYSQVYLSESIFVYP